MEKATNRNSSIELLKVIAILIIILCHAVPCSGDINNVYYFNPTIATNNVSEFLLILFRYLGGIGNVLFFICSSYFLTDSKKIKKEKIVSIILNTFIISILFLIIYTMIYGLPAMSILIKQFFPITFGNTWFITCYLLLYLIHPLLNIILKNISKETHLTIISIMFVLYSLIGFALKNNFYYNELICFIYIYFIVDYTKKYLKKLNYKKNFIIMTGSLCIWFLIILVTNILGLKFQLFSDKVLHWAGICNPFTILFCLSLFNIFKEKNYYNKGVNLLSQQTLFVYLIHENYLFRTYIKPEFYEMIYSNTNYIIGTFIQAFCIIVLSFIFSFLYRFIFTKVIEKISKHISNLLNNFFMLIGVIVNG